MDKIKEEHEKYTFRHICLGAYPSTSGRLTVTGLDAYTGKWIQCDSYTLINDTSLVFGDSSTVGLQGLVSRIQIPQSGSVTFYVWNVPTMGEVTGYNGTNSNLSILAIIYDGNSMVTATGALMANFTNGIASGTFYANP